MSNANWKKARKGFHVNYSISILFQLYFRLARPIRNREQLTSEVLRTQERWKQTQLRLQI